MLGRTDFVRHNRNSVTNQGNFDASIPKCNNIILHFTALNQLDNLVLTASNDKRQRILIRLIRMTVFISFASEHYALCIFIGN